MKKIFTSKIFSQKTLRLLYFVLFVLLLSLFPAPNIYFQSVQKANGIFLPENITLPSPPPYPLNEKKIAAPNISAEGIYILDLPSGVVLYEKNGEMRFLPASTTKIATALVSLDHYKLEDVLTVKTVANSGRTMGLLPNEQIIFESLLYGTLVHSANDAAFTLAENYPGGVTNFVSMMNKKVTDLHLSDTHFTNPIGFDDPQNYTTPVDLAKLAKVAIANKIFAKIISTKSITVSDVSFSYFHPLTNVNELLGRVSGVAGVKTGFTDSAGEILVSEVKKNNRSVLFVVLKSHDRFGETVKLIDWVFGNFSWKNIGDITPIAPSQ